MNALWIHFFSALARDAFDEIVPAARYTHTPSGASYGIRGDCIGKGQYGCVYAYDFMACEFHRMPPLGLPRSFCVKHVHREAATEVNAVSALAALMAAHSSAHGFVPAVVLRRDGDCAEVGMPLYTGTLCRLLDQSTPIFATSVVLNLAATVGMLWTAGLAYTDIKPSNVLYQQTKPGVISVVLGDLGSIVPLRGNDGTRPDGIFTFPPQRSVSDAERDHAYDGVVQPEEADVVWSLGVLLMAMTLGTDWIVARLTGTALRGIAAGRGGDLSAAFVSVTGDIEHEAEVMRALNGKAGVRCADALDVSVAAWFGKDSATIAAFTAALRGHRVGT